MCVKLLDYMVATLNLVRLKVRQGPTDYHNNIFLEYSIQK